LDRADEIIATWMDRMLAGQVRPELQLDLWHAATNRTSALIRQKLSEYESRWPKNDPLAPYRPALQGGDAQEGRKVFFEKAEAGCLRCHKINGEGGEVGPDLAGIGNRQSREYILEAMLFPNKQIAAGYEGLVIALSNGTSYTGTLKSENDSDLVVNSPEDGLVTVKKADIKSRNRGLSAMPEGMETLLSKHELRDLVEFLSSFR
jgi:quinoprotein glucose dehydrogenase